MNKISKKKAQQLNIVSRQFVLNKFDLSLLGAGQTLFASLQQARKRVENDPYYIAKDIKYKLDDIDKDGHAIRLMPRIAIIHVIKSAPVFWSAWVDQHNIYAASGFDKAHRPTLHRIDPNGDYQIGNIGVLPLGLHLMEHAIPRAAYVPTIGLDGVVSVDRVSYVSITAAKDALDVSDARAKQYSFLDTGAILAARNTAFKEFNQI